MRATLTLSIRPLIYGNMSENLLLLFLEHILSIPALIYHVENLTPDVLESFHNNALLGRILDLLHNQESLNKVEAKLKGTQGLALLGNVINLFHLEPCETARELSYPIFTVCPFPSVIHLVSLCHSPLFVSLAVYVHENAATNTKNGWRKKRHILPVE